MLLSDVSPLVGYRVWKRMECYPVILDHFINQCNNPSSPIRIKWKVGVLFFVAQVVFSLGKLGNTPLVEQHKCLTTAPPPPPVRPAPPAIRTEIAEEEDAFTDVMRWLMRRNLSEKENPSVYVWGLPPESAIGGKQLGVGFLTSLPCRAMTRTWKDDQWKGCRVHASCFQVRH